MTKRKVLTVSYDSHADVLYITVGKPKSFVGDMDDDRLIWKIEEKSGVPYGVTILDFNEDWSFSKPDLAHKISHKLHVSEKAVLNSFPH